MILSHFCVFLLFFFSTRSFFLNSSCSTSPSIQLSQSTHYSYAFRDMKTVCYVLALLFDPFQVWDHVERLRLYQKMFYVVPFYSNSHLFHKLGIFCYRPTMLSREQACKEIISSLTLTSSPIRVVSTTQIPIQ
jgi:hypothetical protein